MGILQLKHCDLLTRPIVSSHELLLNCLGVNSSFRMLITTISAPPLRCLASTLSNSIFSLVSWPISKSTSLGHSIRPPAHIRRLNGVPGLLVVSVRSGSSHD